MGWQWHQLDHMQVNRTSHKTDNHASSSSLIFQQAGCSSRCPTSGVKAVNASQSHQMTKQLKLEMWANAQRDGRPAEYRWRPLFNAV